MARSFIFVLFTNTGGVMNSRRVSWVEHVELMEIRNAYKILVEKAKWKKLLRSHRHR
jgi:hypothetical protein